MSSEDTALAAIYKSADALLDVNAKFTNEGVDEFSANASHFQCMMDNAKVGPKCKQLALNVLPKYVSKFPDMADSALDILIDLFEESDKYHLKAIQGFRVIAGSASSPVVSKLVGVLGQIILSEDEKEVEAVNDALVQALERDVKATLSALFEQMSSDEQLRNKTTSFIQRELIPRANSLLNSSDEVQTFVSDNLKRIMGSGINSKEFNLFMKVLFCMNKYKNGEEGANELLDFVHTSIDLSSDFAPNSDQADKFILCAGSAKLIFQHGASPYKLFSYISKKVLPKFEEMSESHQTSLLKIVAEISPFALGSSARE
eukprot:748164-Hanusia_phi.AAC.3